MLTSEAGAKQGQGDGVTALGLRSMKTAAHGGASLVRRGGRKGVQLEEALCTKICPMSSGLSYD
jgi:hypothetical protein